MKSQKNRKPETIMYTQRARKENKSLVKAPGGKKPPKNVTEFILCCYLLPTWSPSLRAVCFLSETVLEKTNVTFGSGYQWGYLWVRDVGLSPLLLSVLGSYQAWTCADLCMLPQSLSSHAWHVTSAYLKGLLLRVSSILSALTIYLPLGPEGRDLMETFSFRTECFQVSHPLHIFQLWVSVFVST